jgi:hypothetical protein
MWQGLQTIMGCKKGKSSHVTDTDVLLPDKLNPSFARFEDNTVQPTRATPEDGELLFSVANVNKIFKRLNPRKAASPYSIPGLILRACADQLAGVFTGHIQSQSAIPTCFKMSTIIPVPNKQN